MSVETATELVQLLKNGGPWAIAALAVLAWVWERRENKKLQESILELATAQTEAVVKHEASLSTLKELIAAFIGMRHH